MSLRHVFPLFLFHWAASELTDWQAEPSCETGTGLFQTAQRAQRAKRMVPSAADLSPERKGAKLANDDPLKKRIYFAGAWHKSGSNLIWYSIEKAFAALGFDEDACREDYFKPESESVPDGALDCLKYPSHLRLLYRPDIKHISRLRLETLLTGGMRGVILVRDPFEMIVSSYSYHHRGAEPWNEQYAANMTQMEPEEGIPTMAQRMYNTIEHMVLSVKVAWPDVFVAHYEALTENSEVYNSTYKEILDFFFDKELSAEQKQLALDAASEEDLNNPYNKPWSLSEGGHYDYNHTSSEDLMERARQALVYIPPDLMETYWQWREDVGYPRCTAVSSLPKQLRAGCP